jgi:hypothetical protein
MEKAIGTTNKRAVNCTCGRRIEAGVGFWDGKRFVCPSCVEYPEVKTAEMRVDPVDDAIEASFVEGESTFTIRMAVVSPGRNYEDAKEASGRVAVDEIRRYGLLPADAKLFYSKKVLKENGVTHWRFIWTITGTTP